MARGTAPAQAGERKMRVAADPEFAALSKMMAALRPLDHEARGRVIEYARSWANSQVAPSEPPKAEG